MSEELPKQIYSKLHLKILEAEGWIHELGAITDEKGRVIRYSPELALKRIATDDSVDSKIEDEVDGLIKECKAGLKRYKDAYKKAEEENRPKPYVVGLHGDLVYALRIMAKLAGPRVGYTTKGGLGGPVEREYPEFAFEQLKEIAGMYNNMVGRGKRIQSVYVEFYGKKEKKEKEKKLRGRIALGKNELILEEVA